MLLAGAGFLYLRKGILSFSSLALTDSPGANRRGYARYKERRLKMVCITLSFDMSPHVMCGFQHANCSLGFFELAANDNAEQLQIVNLKP